MPPRLRPTLPLAAALAVLLGGCAKDLELPPRSTAPFVTALGPASAYAGQLVRLEGSGLDRDPGANVVTFAAATARGLRFDGTALVVRVPEDAGSGPIIVTNGRGTSAPFGDFGYLGLGEPRRRALTSGLPVLHAPRAVHGVGGDVFVDSRVYEGLLSSGDGGFTTPRADLSAAADWKGALFAAELASTTATIWRVAAAGGARAGPVVAPFRPTALAALRGVDLLVAFASSGSEVAAWDLDTLDPLLAPTAVAGLAYHLAAADVRDGRVVVAGLDDQSYDAVLALLDFGGVRGGGPFPAARLVPGVLDVPLDAYVAVAVADAADAGAGIALGEPLAAVALQGGDLAVARLGADPRYVGTVETFSPSPVAGLSGAATVPVVLATKPADGLAVGADLLARRLVWSVAGSAPGPTGATGDVALVAHGGDDDVSVVNLANGSKVARVSFDVAPSPGSAAGWSGSVAVLPRDPAVIDSEDLLFFASGRFPGLLRFSLGRRDATCVLRAPGIGPLAATPDGAGLWVARSGAPAAIDLLAGRGSAPPVTIPLPGVAAVTELAVQGSTVAAGTVADGGGVGGGGGITLLGPAGISGSRATGGIGAAGLGFAPDGRLWAVPHVGSTQAPQLWDPAQLVTGGTWDAMGVFPVGTASSAVWLEDGLWLLGRGTAAYEALLLGPDLAVARTVPLAGDAPSDAVVSPNGRLLVERVVGGATGQTVLRFYRADPEVGFPLVDTLVVDGNVEGLTFDGTGERLWMITRSPDRVLLVD